MLLSLVRSRVPAGRRLIVSLAGVAAAAALAACGGGDGGGGITNPPPANGVASVSLDRTSASIQVGATTTLVATPKDASGNAMSGQTVTWTSSDATIASVDGAGLVTGKTAGSATITATSGGKSAQATITVQVPVASITINPAIDTLLVYVYDSVALGTKTFVATPKDANGAALSGRTVTWTSSNTAIAKVDANGLVTAISPGIDTVTATSEGKSAIAVVAVGYPLIAQIKLTPTSLSLKAGASQTIDVQILDAQGRLLTHRAILEVSSDSNIATIAGQVITGKAAGTATITFQDQQTGVRSTVTVTVTP